MNTRILKRTIVADKTVAHICQIMCSITGGLVLALGIRRLAAIDLDEAQFFTAVTGTLLLSSAFIILAFLCRAWRRAA